jgi:hypothetical protein
MSQSARLLGRFATGLLVSALGGFLTTAPWEHVAEPPAFATTASLEMMRLLRDEHGVIVDMVKAQLAAGERESQRQGAATAEPDATLGATNPSPGDRRSLRARGRRNI